MERFTTRYPGILLNIQEMAQNKMELVLAEDGLDLGIAFSEVSSPEIDCQPLFAEKLTIMVGITHPRANQGGTMTLAELQAESLALLTGDFITRQLINSFFRAHGIAPHISIEAHSIGAIVEIIRRGNLVTILPHLIAHENERLCPILLDPPLPYRTAALLRRKGSYETAAADAFSEIFQSTIPAYAQDDHLTIEVPPCKQLLKTAQLAHHPSSDSRKATVLDRPWIFAPEPEELP